MPKPINCDPIVYFVGHLMGNVARILNGKSTAAEEEAARRVGFASAFEEALAFTRSEQAERLAMLLVERMGYDLEPQEWLERFVIPKELPDPQPRKELGRLVKPVDGRVKMIFRTGDKDEVITLRVEPQTTD
jgi:hypothetical protein